MANIKVRVSAIIINEGNILLIHRHNHGREYWVLPGGKVEDGETPKEALFREVKEETNLSVISQEFSFYTNRFDEDKYIHPCFICEVSHGPVSFNGPEAGIDPQDQYSAKWVMLNDLNSLTIYPEMIKGKLLELDHLVQ